MDSSPPSALSILVVKELSLQTSLSFEMTSRGSLITFTIGILARLLKCEREQVPRIRFYPLLDNGIGVI